MEISIILTILLIAFSLAGAFLQEGMVCLISGVQMVAFIISRYDLMNSLCRWAVKLIRKDLYLLNIVTLNTTQKAFQTTLIYTEISTFRG